MPVFFRVHEGAVASFMNPGDDVDELVWDVTRTTRDLAILYAPVRSGKLKGSIRGSRPKRTGVYTNASNVTANAGYALYVHDGVKGRIYPKKGKYLTVPIAQGSLSGSAIRGSGNRRPGDSRGYFLAKSVRGQASQPFLADALKVAMRTNNVLGYRVA
jgi:hypothetical protein